MSLFQCEGCGCCENTACTDGWRNYKEGRKFCSECNGNEWHGRFRKILLPKGMFKTNRDGNLEHIETGETDFSKYEIKQ